LKWFYFFNLFLRQLGLIENNILNYDFDLVASDPSDANTNSATFFSDDTDDKSKRSNNPEAGISIQQEQAEISIQQEEVNVNCFGNYFSVLTLISAWFTLSYIALQKGI